MKYPFLFLPFLFVWTFVQSQSNPADCLTAYILCNKEAVTVDALTGPGNNVAEIGNTDCQNQVFAETNSVWFKWIVASSGALNFTVLPLDEQDDLDFVLYRLSGSVDNCNEKQELRCMLAGRILGEAVAQDIPCTGATGLKPGAQKTYEGIGCAEDSGNFLAPVTVEAGASYALFIHNYRSSKGFMLEFSGSCTFLELPGHCITSSAPVLHTLSGNIISVSAVYPNPSMEEAWIDLLCSVPLTGSLLLVDAQGRVLTTRSVPLVPGENSIDIPVASLNPGVYFVKMRFDDHVYLSRFYKG